MGAESSSFVPKQQQFSIDNISSKLGELAQGSSAKKIAKEFGVDSADKVYQIMDAILDTTEVQVKDLPKLQEMEKNIQIVEKNISDSPLSKMKMGTIKIKANIQSILQKDQENIPPDNLQDAAIKHLRETIHAKAAKAQKLEDIEDFTKDRGINEKSISEAKSTFTDFINTANPDNIPDRRKHWIDKEIIGFVKSDQFISPEDIEAFKKLPPGKEQIQKLDQIFVKAQENCGKHLFGENAAGKAKKNISPNQIEQLGVLMIAKLDLSPEFLKLEADVPDVEQVFMRIGSCMENLITNVNTDKRAQVVENKLNSLNINENNVSLGKDAYKQVINDVKAGNDIPQKLAQLVVDKSVIEFSKDNDLVTKDQKREFGLNTSEADKFYAFSRLLKTAEKKFKESVQGRDLTPQETKQLALLLILELNIDTKMFDVEFSEDLSRMKPEEKHALEELTGAMTLLANNVPQP